MIQKREKIDAETKSLNRHERIWSKPLVTVLYKRKGLSLIIAEKKTKLELLKTHRSLDDGNVWN